MFLKFFTKESLWREVMKREGFDTIDKIEAAGVWVNVFHKVPELLNYLKRREVQLLQSTTLGEKPNDFILGQIAENRLIQRFDTGTRAIPEKEVKKIEKKLISKEKFLTGWNKQKVEENK